MDKRYCIVKEIDGIPTIDNIVMATEEIAAERGFVEIPDAEIGDTLKDGKPEKKPKPERKSKDPLAELINLLADKNVITKDEANKLKKG